MDLLDELDAYLDSASTKAKLESKKEKLTRQANHKRATTTQRAEARAKLSTVLDQLQAIQWKPVSNVALFSEQVCTCGSTSTIFLQFMLEEETISRPKVTRLSKISREISGLGGRILRHRSKTTICANCADAHGFDLHDAEIKFSSSPLTPGNFE